MTPPSTYGGAVSAPFPHPLAPPPTSARVFEHFFSRVFIELLLRKRTDNNLSQRSPLTRCLARVTIIEPNAAWIRRDSE